MAKRMQAGVEAMLERMAEYVGASIKDAEEGRTEEAVARMKGVEETLRRLVEGSVSEWELRDVRRQRRSRR